jgi:deoxyribonuclease-1-like protein
MARFAVVVLVVVVVAGGIFFVVNYEIEPQKENGKTVGWKIVPRRPASGEVAPGDRGAPPAAPERPTVRIATFNLGRFDEAKLANPRISDVLIHLFTEGAGPGACKPRFDLVALQGIRGKNRGALARLVEQLNEATGQTFDYLVSPTQQRDALEHYSAFLLNRAVIEEGHASVGFVEDPAHRFRIKPLVGWFRVRGPKPEEAFTFWLINVETDPDPKRAPQELAALAEAYLALRSQKPVEDDVIVLGDFEADDKHLGPLGRLMNVTALVSGVPTTVRGTQQLANILIDRRATCEFTGRVDVVDMMREFGLDAAGAQEISDHLPVWAEFSAHEKGEAGVAAPTAVK